MVLYQKRVFITSGRFFSSQTQSVDLISNLDYYRYLEMGIFSSTSRFFYAQTWSLPLGSPPSGRLGNLHGQSDPTRQNHPLKSTSTLPTKKFCDGISPLTITYLFNNKFTKMKIKYQFNRWSSRIHSHGHLKTDTDPPLLSRVNNEIESTGKRDEQR